jgi:chromosome segregation ATPase
MFYKATPTTTPIENKRPTAAPTAAELPEHMQQLVDKKIA